MKFAGRDAAERDAFDGVLLCERQTGAVARREKRPVSVGKPAAHDRADSVQDAAAGQVEGRCDLGVARFLGAPLLCHDFGAGGSELHTGIGVNGIVDAAVIRVKAAEQAAVCGVYDRIAFQRGDIALPQIQAVPYRPECAVVDDTLLLGLRLQVGVLHP